MHFSANRVGNVFIIKLLQNIIRKPRIHGAQKYWKQKQRLQNSQPLM